MLDKLQELEQLLTQITNQYHVVATELINLKNRPSNEAKHEATIDELSIELDIANERLAELETNAQNQSKQLDEHARLIESLTQQNNQLITENDELKQKNRLAIERADIIQTWLANIDNATNHQGNKEKA